MERIFNLPNHEHYGPVRRQWVIFQGLGLTDDSGADQAYLRHWGTSWDQHLSICIRYSKSEAEALRRITWNMLVAFDASLMT